MWCSQVGDVPGLESVSTSPGWDCPPSTSQFINFPSWTPFGRAFLNEMKDKQMENIILPGLEFTLRPSEVSLWLLQRWHRTCAAGIAAGGQTGSPHPLIGIR